MLRRTPFLYDIVESKENDKNRLLGIHSLIAGRFSIGGLERRLMRPHGSQAAKFQGQWLQEVS